MSRRPKHSRAITVPKPDKPDKVDFDLVALNHSNSNYTAEQKVAVVTQYVLTGSASTVSKNTGVPVGVINHWKKHSNWWDETAADIKLHKNEELEAVLTHTLHLASEEMLDRIEHGNEVIVNGDHMRVKIPARELSQVINTMYEKRALLRGDPSKIMLEKKVDFSDLASQFRDFSREILNEKVVN